jgi:hypothetical protein
MATLSVRMPIQHVVLTAVRIASRGKSLNKLNSNRLLFVKGLHVTEEMSLSLGLLQGDVPLIMA